MRRIEFAAQAQRDLDELLAFSEAQFGARAADRYRALLALAFNGLCVDPTPPGTALIEPEGAVHLYHLKHARQRAPQGERVGQPRHFIVYRFDGKMLLIVRVLHDAMDLEQHIANDDEPG